MGERRLSGILPVQPARDSPANQSAEIIDVGSHEENTDTETAIRDDEGFRDYCEKLSYINHEASKVQKLTNFYFLLKIK